MIELETNLANIDEEVIVEQAVNKTSLIEMITSTKPSRQPMNLFLLNLMLAQRTLAE